MNVSAVRYSNYFIFNNDSQSASAPVTSDHTIVNQPPGTEKESRDTVAARAKNPGNSSGQNSDSNTASDSTKQTVSQNGTNTNGQALSDAEMRVVEKLEKIDQQVKQHEMAHIAAGGQYITSGANFSYKRGPDGKNYAVAGEVKIDTSPVPGDPEATMKKMRQVRASALAPADPSAQDLKVAAKATSLATEAMAELIMLQARERSGNIKNNFTTMQEASASYVKVYNLPESDTSTFQLSV